MRIFLFLLFLQVNFLISAQSDLVLGEWEAHLSYQRCNWLTQSADFVYVNTGNNLIKINKEDIRNGELIEPEYISKIEGLSETQIDKIAYDEFNQQLIITYASSNIDIITKDEIINIPFIKDNVNIVGSRVINDIHIADAKTCYFAGAFGVINMDLEKLEFKYTTFTPSTVLSVSSDTDRVYMGLDDGLYAINKNDNNPIDFSRWQFLSSESGLPALYTCSDLQTYNDEVYAVIDNDFYQEKDGVFSPLELNIPNGYKVQFMSADRENLLIGLRNEATRNAEVRLINSSYEVKEGGAGCINELIYGIELEDGSIWYADGFREIRYTEGLDFGCQKITFESPRSNDCSQIEVKDDQVFFASGGASDNYALQSNREGIYILEDNQWDNINGADFPIINEKFYLNFVSVAPHPKENIVYMASYYTGIVSYNLDTKELIFFDADNSKLQGVEADDSRARVAYAMFDDDENLWMANFASPEPIVVMSDEGIWYSFDIPISNTNLAKMTIDQNGYIWYTIIGNNGGVLVFDKGDKLADPTDDRYRVFTSSNSELPSPLVNSLAVDLDGDVWVGTSQGPVAFECDVFDEDCIGSRRKVLQDSIAAFLLDTEEILAIEIDGANRKWFGTKNGIFVQSPDAEFQIDQFNIDNSPLFSNTILDLDYDDKSGRMYISTNNGIQSLRTETTGARTRHDRSNVYAFPNPVTPDYEGPIAIKGLGRDANVKITDLNGKLIFETTALGGQAIWNGMDYNGRKAASGVYLVFSSSRVSFDTSDEFVTKIMVID